MYLPNPTIFRPGASLLGPKLIDLWDAWCFAAADAALALAHWRTVTPDGRGEAFASYQAALDREEHAAMVLGARVAGRRAVI